ncbi:acyl-CoA desaturase [Dactylosporangium fulvum]|uniref:Acyl-CoA desaturase n=1 Tax=Dactylosporangium fulvum TaxID=53359 RepID=A0ABY5W7M2_9ACTN|nr:acyl-CoA desaturase [Dactylosporangium fulvum]UWP85464.1 acyl-CoA desaturase [Dactylosporangium fulvum]
MTTKGTLLAQDDAAPRAAAPGSDYADLLHRVKAAGLLRRRYGYYLMKIAVTGALYVAAWAVFAVLGDSWWQLTVAALLAVMFTQIGFLGHDAGHRQIFRSRWANDLAGLLLANLAVGLSYGWWVDKHNRHHAHPNQEDRDPDLDIGALAFTAGQARAKRGPVTRFIARRQRYLFFPLLLLEALQLHVSSVRALAGPRLRHRFRETLLLLLHVAGYLAAVLLVLSPLKAAVFIVVQQALFGLYLGCSFAPNHKGMPVLPVHGRTDFLRRQVLTARNVRGSWLVDSALGGLNYQIEHHLFPSMPRPNLRRAQALVRSFCRQHDVSYCETTLLRSYAQALQHLHDVGRPLRRLRAERGPCPPQRGTAAPLQ